MDTSLLIKFLLNQIKMNFYISKVNYFNSNFIKQKTRRQPFTYCFLESNPSSILLAFRSFSALNYQKRKQKLENKFYNREMTSKYEFL